MILTAHGTGTRVTHERSRLILLADSPARISA